MRTFVVGDVHGHAEKLRALLPLLKSRATTGDSLVFVGDYIDRGPDSRGVVDLVLAASNGDWPGPVLPLKGNHEDMLLDSLSPRPRYPRATWTQNGGRETIASYADGHFGRGWEQYLPPEHSRFFRDLPLWHADENGIYVHAGLRPGTSPADADEEALLWIREEFIDSDYEWDRVVVFGHTPQFEAPRRPHADYSELKWRPLVRPEKIGIDTGAAYGGPLTAVILPEREFVNVDNVDNV